MEAVLTEQQHNVLMLSAMTPHYRDALYRVSKFCCALFHIYSQEMSAYLSQIHRAATDVYLYLLFTKSVGIFTMH